MRHNAAWPIHFRDHGAGIRRDLLPRVEPVFRAANQRLGQVDRVVVMMTHVRMSPRRVRNWVSVALSLRKTPTRRL